MDPRDKRPVIDLTTPPTDHFTALPSELIHSIIGYLLPNHKPDIAFLNHAPYRYNSYDAPHPLACLAATCKALRSETEQWALHFFKQHATITGYKSSTLRLRPDGSPKVLHGRAGFLNWIKKNCAFCGKKSVRTAIFSNGLRCCAKCDRNEWPDKITKTEARTTFDLKDHHLLPHTSKYPGQSGYPRDEALPRVHYGTYKSSNVPTTMFLRYQVAKLADYVHGNAEEHMSLRKNRAEERKSKKKANDIRRGAQEVSG